MTFGGNVFNHAQTPTLLITVATAWAAQASAVVASTLSAVLKPGGNGSSSSPLTNPDPPKQPASELPKPSGSDSVGLPGYD